MTSYRGIETNDDTSRLQAMLDGRGSVYLPDGVYTVSRPLVIYENSSLRLDYGATLRLADGANCALLRNARFEATRAAIQDDVLGSHERDARISVSGGVWDGNNANQQRELSGENWGVALDFSGVEDFYLGDLTVKDPESFSVRIHDAERFTVERVTFDHNMLRHNMDGIHVNGPARFGLIRDIKGATNDDLVALNGNEVCEGAIEHIAVENLFADGGYTAVRLLSCGSPLRDVSIRGVYGTYRFYAVSFTHHNIRPGKPILLEDVLVDGVFASKPLAWPDEALHYGKPYPEWIDSEPLIAFMQGVYCRNILLKNILRVERGRTHAPLIRVYEGARVDGLLLRDIRQRFEPELEKEPPLFENRGIVTVLRTENAQIG